MTSFKVLKSFNAGGKKYKPGDMVPTACEWPNFNLLVEQRFIRQCVVDKEYETNVSNTEYAEPKKPAHVARRKSTKR